MEEDLTNTKRKIFYASVALFSEKGYRVVTMRDIAKEVGIEASSIYNHFKSKDEILDALLQHYLDCMEKFYCRMRGTSSKIDKSQSLSHLLEKLILVYDKEDQELMYHLTRIVHHEQFRSHKAADALIGSGYRRYLAEHVHYFDQLSDAGCIQGKERNQMYGELFARISLTFATQFLHPEIPPTIVDQAELYRFVIAGVVSYEENLKRQR